MIDKHVTDYDPKDVLDLRCPTDLVEHIAEIEAGWTLRKWWKVEDEEAAQEENRQEVREMLARWKAHGIVVSMEHTMTDTTREPRTAAARYLKGGSWISMRTTGPGPNPAGSTRRSSPSRTRHGSIGIDEGLPVAR